MSSRMEVGDRVVVHGLMKNNKGVVVAAVVMDLV